MKLKDLKNMDKEDILESLGLQSRPSTGEWLLGSFGLFGIGLLVGASAALLLAPKAGRDLRRDIGTKFGKASSRIRGEAEDVEQSLDG